MTVGLHPSVGRRHFLASTAIGATYGTVHAVRNVSSDDVSHLATHVVEKDKPLLVPAN